MARFLGGAVLAALFTVAGLAVVVAAAVAMAASGAGSLVVVSLVLGPPAVILVSIAAAGRVLPPPPTPACSSVFCLGCGMPLGLWVGVGTRHTEPNAAADGGA